MEHPTRRLPAHAGDDPVPDGRPTRHLEPQPPGPPTTCLRCGGPTQRFRAHAGSSDGGALVVVNPDRRPDLWHGLRPTQPVAAQVCLDCGYTEFYTEQPRRLLEEG